jgi:hypothetical protein
MKLVLLPNCEVLKMKYIKIKNNREVENWLVHHATELGNHCRAIRGRIFGGMVNVAYIDEVTKERISLEYVKDDLF